MSPEMIVAIGFLLVLAAVAVVTLRYARHIKVTVGKVEAEFRPNGGSSLKDAITRLERTLAPLATQVADHETRITRLENPPKPRVRKKAA